MAFGLPFRRKPPEPTPATDEPAPAAPPTAVRAGLRSAWSVIEIAFTALDDALCSFATPFGAYIADPKKRYAVMLGVFGAIYVAGALPVPYLPLVALGIGYVGVLAIGRAWVRNEKQRTAIVKKLRDDDPDQMPDLRGTALVSALQLLILFPLIFLQLQRHFGLYQVHGEETFLQWLWFSLDKTYLKALPDWTTLYGLEHSQIGFDSHWGRHVVLLSRLTFDWILIQGLVRLLAIRGTVREAMAALKADPSIAVRLGGRAVGPLIEKLDDPDKEVRGAAANALTQLGASHGLERIGAAKKP
jgi:hypothetical protein